jgi:hypothetical protein
VQIRSERELIVGTESDGGIAGGPCRDREGHAFLRVMTMTGLEMALALRGIDEFRAHLQETAPETLDAVALERTVQDLIHGVGRALMTEVFRQADSSTAEVRINGELWGHRRITKGTYMTLFGEVEMERSTYTRNGRGRVAVPLELRLGIVEDRYTPVVARVMTHAIAVMTAEEGEQLLTEAGVCKVSRSTLHRVPQAMAARYDRERHVIDPAVRSESLLPSGTTTVQVALDGVMVPQDGEHAKARGRKTTSPAPARHEARYGADPTLHPHHDDGLPGRAWHEASVGTISCWNAEGQLLQTTYLAQMPESGKATLCQDLEAELHAVLAERPDVNVCLASDGAPHHWTVLEGIVGRLPERATGERWLLLDFFHAAEYLTQAANEVYGKDTADARVEAAMWRETLKEKPDGAYRVLKALRYQRDKSRSQARREELDGIISYLAGHDNEGRMRYAEAKAGGLPIGTGVTEAAAKTVVNVRMKRAGARYSQHGGQTILVFRTAVLSQRFERLSHHLEATYAARVEAA